MKYDYTDKKTRTMAWVAILLIPTIVITYFIYHRYQLDKHMRKTYGVITSKRKYKAGLDIAVTFTVDKYVYTAKDTWSVENQILKSINSGDTVIVEYSQKDPNVNEIVFR
jgi:hypothetical protein